jgi:hypothetical protein
MHMMASVILASLALGSLLVLGPALMEDVPSAAPPPYQKLRYEEDYTFLREVRRRVDVFDPLKYLPLVPNGTIYLSLGGELRARYEYTRNPAWGQDPQDTHGVFLQRYVLHGDLHLTQSVRVFAQLLSALADGRAGGASPVDADTLDLQQAFLDLRVPVGSTGALTLRAGRQELAFGSGRLVDVREGPNVRRTFDGGRLIVQTPAWRVEGFVMRPAEDERGVFDDGSDTSRALWGVYSVGTLPLLSPGGLDLYYLGFQDDQAVYVQGTGEETRHSLGLRLWGAPGAWDYNGEVVYQWGTFGAGEIQAWTVALSTGYTWTEGPWRPRVGLSTNIASGDRDATDRDLETFNPLFPRGSYFSETALLGPRNFFNVQPSLTLTPLETVSVTLDVNWFWRLQTADGLYSPSGQPLRGANGSTARFVGSNLALKTAWHLQRHVTITATYEHFFPGAFLRETGPHAAIDFIELTFQVLF